MSNTKCPKCEGKGALWFYTHIENGKCFTCNGTGKVAISAPLHPASDLEAVIAEALVETHAWHLTRLCYALRHQMTSEAARAMVKEVAARSAAHAQIMREVCEHARWQGEAA